MTDNRFRWRTNPAIVAQYYTGDQLPNGVEAHLKPNEACAVIENGEVVGIATSTTMTINPELGTLSKLLKRSPPTRSFMFAFLGPHELLVPLNGLWADGGKGVGMAGLKMQLRADDVGRLLTLAAKGTTTITLGDMANTVAHEISNKFAAAHMTGASQADARSDPATATLLEAGLRTIAQPALAELGGALDRVWLSWTPSDHERILRMRKELEMMAEEQHMISEKNRLEMERILAQEINVLERQHQLHLAATEYEAKGAAASELAELRVKAEKEREKWAVVTQRDELEAGNRLRRAELDADHQDSVANLRHGNEMNQLDRTMDLEDKKAELERRRRERKMQVADEQAEYLRQQEMKAAKHNNKMLRGAFDAMDGDDTE